MATTTHMLRNGGLDAMLEGGRARLAGPGGYYNAGNALGLVVGVALQVGATAGGTGAGSGLLAAITDYCAGNAAAVALTAATAVFFVSGEAYHRAWAQGAPPDPGLNRRGDLLSGIGALILGLALISLGQWLPAATAGFLHALGKFGSAGHWRAPRLWRRSWPDVWRTAVLASRLPALLTAAAALIAAASRDAGTPLAAILAPLTLLVCTALWARADLMLFGGGSAPARD